MFLRILTYMVPLSQKIGGMVMEGRVNYTHDYPSLSLYLGGDISVYWGSGTFTRNSFSLSMNT